MADTARRRGLRGGALKADMDLLEARLGVYSLGMTAENTDIAYSGQWSRYLEWCKVNELDAFEGGPRPVCLYLTYLTDVRDYAPATLRQALSALRNRYRREMGDENPTKAEVVSRTLKACCGFNARKTDQKKPLRAKHLVRIVERVEGSGVARPREWARDKALLLVGWAGAYRRSELTSLQWQDVKFMVDDAARIFLCQSKTDQGRHGHWSEIGAGANASTCPVAALKEWWTYFDDPGGCVFRGLYRAGATEHLEGGLEDPAVNAIVKKYVGRIGLDPGEFGGHSLRAGWITDAKAAGMPDGEIMRHSRHRSFETMEGYNRPHESFVGGFSEKAGL